VLDNFLIRIGYEGCYDLVIIVSRFGKAAA